MPQIHLRAEVGDYAPLVLLPGDPKRATRIASLFDGGLAASRHVNEHRGCSATPAPTRACRSASRRRAWARRRFSIVVEELLRLGATRLIRVGTTGGIGRGIHTGDLVIATAAAPVDGATRTYLHGDPFAPVADFGLTRALVDAARAAGVQPFIGPVATVDVFYNPDEDYVTQVAGRAASWASRWRRRRCSTSPSRPRQPGTTCARPAP